ncbi:MAG TPA: glutathione S-transferase family protein [Stellaceae bacterium]|jgi:glutathione S-transferase|nr:glutathione S-transferase family protein [Stellaceae bacterium]
MLYLYQGSTSVCSVKVRIALEEKGLAFEGEILDLQRGDQHRPDYAKLNPNEVVPTLIHDGKVLIESTLIIEYLDEAFPDPPLMPIDPALRHQARLFMKKIDDYLHAACSTVTFATANRKVLIQKTPDELAAHLAKIPNLDYRERQQLSITQGLAAPHVAQALKNYDKYIADMETALSTHPYVAGAQYSLADAAATPYIFRAEAIGLDGLWRGRRPNVAAWYERVRARASFEKAVIAPISVADRHRFDVPREESWAKAREVLGIR